MAQPAGQVVRHGLRERVLQRRGRPSDTGTGHVQPSASTTTKPSCQKRCDLAAVGRLAVAGRASGRRDGRMGLERQHAVFVVEDLVVGGRRRG